MDFVNIAMNKEFFSSGPGAQVFGRDEKDL